MRNVLIFLSATHDCNLQIWVLDAEMSTPVYPPVSQELSIGFPTLYAILEPVPGL